MKNTNLFKSSLLPVILLFCFGFTNVWGQVETLTITRSNFTTSTGYGTNDSWEVTSSDDEEISGYCDIFGSTTNSMQVGTSSSNFFYNTIAIPGVITKITMTKSSGTDRTWTPFLSSDTVLTKNVSESAGTAQTSQLVTSSPTVWNIDEINNFKYFYLKSGGNTNISSIIIEYKTTSGTEPNLTVSSISLNPFNYAEGNGPSTVQPFTASGTNLDGDPVTATAPTGYEISLTGDIEDFAASKNITYSDSAFTDQTIYVRLASGLPAGAYTGNISIFGGGDITAATKAVTGNVTPGNDDCGNAEVLIVNDTSVDGTLEYSTLASGFSAAGGGGNTDVWYSFMAISNDTHTISVGGFNDDVDVRIYSVNCGSVTPSNYITSNISGGATANDPEVVTFDGTSAGQIYLIRVFAYEATDNSSDFFIQVTAEIPEPTILTNPVSVPAMTTTLGGADDTESVTVTGINLEGDVTVVLSDDTHFSISINSFPQTDGNASGTLTITYSPITVGNHTATITLSSPDADAVVLNLNGTATIATPVATAATETGPMSFIANWNAVAGAENYEIDIYKLEEGGFATDLFISEYVEGSNANNRYIEIYNGTGSDVNLNDYRMRLYANGANSPNTDSQLSGILANGTTIVYRGNNSNVGDYSGTSIFNSALSFNGDDAVVLYRISTESNVDIFGKIGVDPGTAWTGAGGYSTLDKTLQRKSSVIGGITENPSGTGSSSFTTLTTEWNLFNDGTVSGLGSHTFDGGLTLTYIPGHENLNVGNITSYEVTGLDPETTYYYVVRAVAGSSSTANSNEIQVTTEELPTTITWLTGGGWSNGIGPETTDDDIIIEGDLVTTTDLLAKNLTVIEGGSITIASGNSVTLAGKITNNAGAESFIVESGANLIQNMDYTANDNEGGITVQRDSREIVRLDYTMWSSPVNTQQLQAFSPSTLPERIYTYESDAGVPAGAYVQIPSATANFENGKGYLFRAPNNWPYAETEPVGASYEGAFIGEPFNGDVNVTVFPNGYTSVGNPYPSNIDPELLLAGNDIQALYFWNNPERVFNEETETWGYSGIRYITFTGAGFSDSDYDGNSITVGQGFIVESTTSSVNFSNDMRIKNAGTFFKNEIERHRLWLDLSNEENHSYNKILVSYMEGATQGIDAQIDGKMFGYSGSALYNLITEQPFIIQGRALPFEASDVIPLGFTAVEAGKFNISLTNFDGLFAEGGVTVFLRDNQLNLTHNLMESAYIFESAAGEFKNRFEIIYEEEGIMGTSDLTAESVQIYRQNQNIVVNSRSEKIISVELFDLQGRNIHRNNKVNANTYQIKSMVKGVLIVRVQTRNGEIVTKKVINN